MNNEIFESKLQKRPLLREKQREERIKRAYNSIPNLKEMVDERQKISIEILKKLVRGENVDLEKKNFENLQRQIDELLVSNNLGKDYLSFKYICDRCKDTGYVDGKACNCVKIDSFEERVKESGMLSEYRNKNFRNFNLKLFSGQTNIDGEFQDSREYMRKLSVFCKNYCDRPINTNFGLYLYGNTGTGKTYLSLSMVNYILENGGRVKFIRATDFFSVIYNYNSHFYSTKKEVEEMIDILKNIDTLVIDDLGNEIRSRENTSFLSDILDYRIERGLKTVITTNIPFEYLSEIYDTRVASRIIGYFKKFEFPIEDLRLKK